MNAQRLVQTTLAAAWIISASGCATVMSGRHADVSFYSNVPNAAVVIRDKRGEQVMVAQTQSKIALKRKDRYIFPARYTATFVAPGYQPVEVPIQSKVNPWVFGNVVFLQAGLVGLAVDNATGAAWTPKEGTFYQELTPLGSTNGPAFTSNNPAAAQSAPIYTASAPTYAPPLGQAMPASATLPAPVSTVAVPTMPQTLPGSPASPAATVPAPSIF